MYQWQTNDPANGGELPRVIHEATSLFSFSLSSSSKSTSVGSSWSAVRTDILIGRLQMARAQSDDASDLSKNIDLQIHCAMVRQIWFHSQSITKAFCSQNKVWTLRKAPKPWPLHIFSTCEPSNCGVCSKAVAFVGTASQASSSAAKPVTSNSAKRQAVALKTMRVRVSCGKAKLFLKVWFWTEKAAVCRNKVTTTPNRHRESWVRFKCSGDPHPIKPHRWSGRPNEPLQFTSSYISGSFRVWCGKAQIQIHIHILSDILELSIIVCITQIWSSNLLHWTPAAIPWPRSPEDGTCGQHVVKLVATMKRYHQTQPILPIFLQGNMCRW